MNNRFVAAVLALIALAASNLSAHAQSPCPAIKYGAVLTAGQWNLCFQGKQDALGYTALNRAGDSMLGRLALKPATSAGSGLNLGIGVEPITPLDGDVWMTSAGIYYGVGGVVYGPLASTISPSFNQINLLGSTSGQITVKAPAIAGANTLTLPAGTTDFSATGGANQVVRQSSAGAALTVSQLGFPDLSGSVAAAQMPAFTGDMTSSAGTTSATVAKINGTTVPSAPSVDQTLIVTGANAATWKSINNCTAGLTYSTSTHVFGCLGASAVAGPGASTANAIPRWSGTGGNAILDSGITVDGSNNVSGVVSIQRTGGVLVQGNNSGAAASAGYVGEVLSQTSGAVTLTTATPAQAAMISLTAGTWDLSGGCSFSGSGLPNATDLWLTIGSASATMNNTPGFSARFRGTSLADPVVVLNSSPRQVGVASTTSYYINAQASFSGGTAFTATCHIRAIRTN